MEEDKPKRPRIKVDRGDIIKDPMAYTDNICSLNAQKITQYSYTFGSVVWKERHYNIRKDRGEDDGTPREGIDEHLVCQLIEDTFPHVIHYGLKYNPIINYPPFNPDKSVRIVLQDKTTGEHDFLNVAVEYHFLDGGSFEVTIWTAMVVSNFYIRDSQYVVELFPDKTVIRRKTRGSLNYLMEIER